MIRTLRPADLPALTQLCMTAMPHDRFTDAIVNEKTFGAKDYVAELAIGYEDGGRLVGFAIGVVCLRRGKQWGHVRLLAVSRAVRERGIGSKLLAEIEARMASRGAVHFSIMDVPANYFMPGVDPRYTEATCFLEKNGYKRTVVNQNMLCEVGPAKYDCAGRIAALGREGIEIRRATRADAKALEAFLGKEFPGWEQEVANALENDPPTVHIALKEGALIAFAAAEGNNKGLGWFGPMGTTPACRGKGIGAITLQLCLNDLGALGHRYAIIPWVGPTRFYALACAAWRDRTFWAYEKGE